MVHKASVRKCQRFYHKDHQRNAKPRRRCGGGTIGVTTSSRNNSRNQIVAYIKQTQTEATLPEVDLVQCLWQGCISSVDWSARPDQVEGLAVREVEVTISTIVS